MTDLSDIQKAVRVRRDENGELVVQIPLDAWEEFIATQRPQHERIQALLTLWEAQPDETPETWWDEFDRFLRENRLNFVGCDPGIDDE